MRIPIFQVDAFSEHQFKGNPAAVMPLDAWLSDKLLQCIAAENNLSETAFYIVDTDHIHLRWFTPTTEVDLCGHATLAAAWVLMNEYHYPEQTMRFQTRSGLLTVKHDNGLFELDFPANHAKECSVKAPLLTAFGETPLEILSADDYLLLFKDEQTIRELKPDFALLSQLPLRGVIATARGDKVDFVSRWFGPNVGVEEDPVTGSAHTVLAPYWANKLDKTRLSATQVSQRSGDLICELKGDRVLISGRASLYLKGEVFLAN